MNWRQLVSRNTRGYRSRHSYPRRNLTNCSRPVPSPRSHAPPRTNSHPFSSAVAAARARGAVWFRPRQRRCPLARDRDSHRVPRPFRPRSPLGHAVRDSLARERLKAKWCCVSGDMPRPSPAPLRRVWGTGRMGERDIQQAFPGNPALSRVGGVGGALPPSEEEDDDDEDEDGGWTRNSCTSGPTSWGGKGRLWPAPEGRGGASRASSASRTLLRSSRVYSVPPIVSSTVGQGIYRLCMLRPVQLAGPSGSRCGWLDGWLEAGS
ncbi:hypothetical protein GGS23DRAFT_236633 [Durotheca rogersii]|uniref:uncharacterized protein n=1 Tax=Durotheca rogersii TaxID=419775 RepID=UPI00221E86C8|nr:uncharacterized protein GGS23DRAFT_236633 [Durotheca rogersii]KAI5860431.1 hypothetical protein GGS23DRAFT_236633 [Durotheca rogersii]